MLVSADQFIRSKRRTIALIVEGNGSITVRVPIRMAAIVIQEFVAKHANWWKRNRQSVAKWLHSCQRNICLGKVALGELT